MSYKNIIVLVCIQAVFGGKVYADTQLKDMTLTFSAYVEPESCTQLLQGDMSTSMDVELPKVKISDVVNLKEKNASKVFAINKEIEFECNAGEYAKFSISSKNTDSCKTDQGSLYLCSGENKSVAMSPHIKWIDKDNNAKQMNAYVTGNSGVVNTIKLSDRKAKIDIPSVYMRTVRDVEPAPGNAEAILVLSVWQP